MDMETARVMPQAEASERYVIGCILMEHEYALERVSGILDSGMFYNESHAVIYKAILEMQAGGIQIDMITVAQYLRKSGEIDNIGGEYYICELTGAVASDTHIVTHAEFIADKYLRRMLIKSAWQACNRAFDETEETADVVASYDTELQHVQEVMSGKRRLSDALNGVKTSISNAYKRASDRREGRSTGITTGFADLDRKLAGGWKAPDLVVLAARPSVGKTALAIHMAKRAARNRIPVLFVSLEMGEIQLYDRMIIGESGVNSYEYNSGNITDTELEKAEKTAFSEIAGLPLYVDDNPNQTVVNILSKARVMKRQGKCGLLIIDYLQLITPVYRPGQNREQEVAQISRSLKLGAKNLDMPVIVLSQQNRKGGSDLATLRDSGAIEQDADIVFFIERNSDDSDVEMVDSKGIPVENAIRLNIKKNRHGETGVVFVTHNSSFTAFYDYEHSRGSVVKPRNDIPHPDRFHESGARERMPF